MSMSDELRKIILETYLKHTEESTTHGLWYHAIAKELGLDENIVKAECGYLEDDECIEEEKMTFPGNKVHGVGVRITSKGKEALQTIYNPEWVTQKNKEKVEAKVIDERRHQELVSASKGSKLIKIGVIAAIGISVLSLFGFEDIFFNPTIEINPFFTDASDSTTQMYLNIWNHGNSPATNVRVTLNPNADFIKKELVYSAEDTTFEPRGPRSLIAFTPRLSAGELITINTFIGIPLDRSHFDIHVTYDQGERVSYSSTLHGKTPFDKLVITLSEEPSSVEFSVYDPVTDEFIPYEP